MGFSVLKLQTHFSQTIIFICCNIFSKNLVICCILNIWVVTCIIIYIFSFQNGLNHPCSSTSFYFQGKIVEVSREIWNFCVFLILEFFSKCTFLRLRHFISPSTYPINSIFLLVVCIFKNTIVAMMTEKMYFPISMATFVREKFRKNYAAYQFRLSLEKMESDKVS